MKCQFIGKRSNDIAVYSYQGNSYFLWESFDDDTNPTEALLKCIMKITSIVFQVVHPAKTT